MASEQDEYLEWLRVVSPIIAELNKMGRAVGSVYLRRHYPQYAAYHEDWLSRVSELPEIPKQTSINYDVHQRKFVAVAWLLGASMPQLGRLFNVAPQTIQRKIDKQLPPGEARHNMRIGWPPYSDTKLVALREKYYGLVLEEPTVFDNYKPAQIAFMLETTVTDHDELEGSAYDELAGPDRKIGSEVPAARPSLMAQIMSQSPDEPLPTRPIRDPIFSIEALGKVPTSAELMRKSEEPAAEPAGDPDDEADAFGPAPKSRL